MQMYIKQQAADATHQRVHQPWPSQLTFDGELFVQQPQVKLHFFVGRDNDALATDVVPNQKKKKKGSHQRRTTLYQSVDQSRSK